jgi:hypothetical protein
MRACVWARVSLMLPLCSGVLRELACETRLLHQQEQRQEQYELAEENREQVSLTGLDFLK